MFEWIHSAARKVDTKVANLLPKVAQQVATQKNVLKTVYNRFLKFTFLDRIKELVHPLRDSNLIEKKTHPLSFWIWFMCRWDMSKMVKTKHFQEIQKK